MTKERLCQPKGVRSRIEENERPGDIAGAQQIVVDKRYNRQNMRYMSFTKSGKCRNHSCMKVSQIFRHRLGVQFVFFRS